MAGLLPTLIGTAVGVKAISSLAPPVISKFITNQGVRAGLPVAEQARADQIQDTFRREAEAIQLLKKSRF